MALTLGKPYLLNLLRITTCQTPNGYGRCDCALAMPHQGPPGLAST